MVLASVVEMHQQGASYKWLMRPLPENLLQYASSDIRLIAHLLSIFDTLGFLDDDFNRLLVCSERYVARCARVRFNDPLRPSAILMLDSLSIDGPTEICARCQSELSLSCFEKWCKKGVRIRREHCRQCVVALLRSGIELPPVWVEMPPRSRLASCLFNRNNALYSMCCVDSALGEDLALVTWQILVKNYKYYFYYY
jgi:hypothetical protein